MTFFAPPLRRAAGFFGDEDTCARGVYKLKYIAEEALIDKKYLDLLWTRRRTRRPLDLKEVRGIPLGVSEDADGPAVDDDCHLYFQRYPRSRRGPNRM